MAVNDLLGHQPDNGLIRVDRMMKDVPGALSGSGEQGEDRERPDAASETNRDRR